MASNITLVITSCDRHSLLKQTIDSFIETTDMQPQETIIVEDSTVPQPDWIKQSRYASHLGKITWIANEARMGQIYSIDRAYAEVKTDYIFHCEDDWLFTDSTGWMRKSKDLLDKYPRIHTVLLRGNTGWHPLGDADEIDKNVRWLIPQPYWRNVWGGITFNPGLRRTADYKKIGSYGRHVAYGTSGLGHEAQLSKMHLDMGYRLAVLPETIVQHTGNDCSRASQPLPAMPKVLIAIPACHKYEYGKWESGDSPHFNQAAAYNGQAYGTGIHISGYNDRIQTVRDTWAKDIEPFKEHVTLKFFYGEPHPRPAASDEVYLPCGDGYEHLPLKTINIARYALEQGYDYVFKCDDDTAVYLDRLIHELMSHKFDYAGYENGRVASGGPGYWLSRRAMKALVANDKPDHWAEDVWTGKVMSYANIPLQMLPGHRPGFSDHWFYPNGFDPARDMTGVVAFHAVQPEVMRDWYAHEHRSKDATQ